jgi:CubicO group peptidase (beta-lactamase class C family)
MMIQKHLAAVLCLFLVCTGCREQHPYVFPGESWEVSTPAEQGLDPGSFQKALKYLESESKQDGIRELLVVRNGYVIYAGPDTDTVHNIWSCSKVFTSTVLGLLVDDGVLTLEDKAVRYEPLLEENYPEVSLRHFTTMTSGYSARGDSRWPTADYEDWSWTVYEPDAPYFPPGEAFAYWDEAQMMFGRVLTQVLDEPMKVFLQRRITDPIGMGEWQWGMEGELNGIQINNGCTNVMVNASQLARFGLLFLNKGNWDGDQLISRQWVEEATSVQVTVDVPVGDTDRKATVGSGCYGFNWWVNGPLPNGEFKLPGAPEGCFFASGLNNNKCIVVPDWNMVIVRMGQDGHPDRKDEVYGTFLKLIGESITGRVN